MFFSIRTIQKKLCLSLVSMIVNSVCLVLGTIFILLMILMLSLIAVWWSNEKRMVIDHLLYKSYWVGKTFGWTHLLKKVTLQHFTCYLSARVLKHTYCQDTDRLAPDFV